MAGFRVQTMPVWEVPVRKTHFQKADFLRAQFPTVQFPKDDFLKARFLVALVQKVRLLNSRISRMWRLKMQMYAQTRKTPGLKQKMLSQ